LHQKYIFIINIQLVEQYTSFTFFHLYFWIAILNGINMDLNYASMRFRGRQGQGETVSGQYRAISPCPPTDHCDSQTTWNLQVPDQVLEKENGPKFQSIESD
jgi:hypothetical protein